METDAEPAEPGAEVESAHRAMAALFTQKKTEEHETDGPAMPGSGSPELAPQNLAHHPNDRWGRRSAA